MKRFIPFHLLVVLSLSGLLAPSICLSAQETAKDSQFIAYDNGIVSDAKTGLEWYPGPDKNTNWQDAKRWVESLTDLAGGGWRMPTRKELKTLYQRQMGEKCHINPLFKTTACFVWTGETRGSSKAWGFDYSYSTGDIGSMYVDGSKSWELRETSSYGQVFAVRSRR
jgi:hypothetical protein